MPPDEELDGEIVQYDRFTLSIELGNAAMQTGRDVADLLRRVADRLDDGLPDGPRPVRDLNGNTVGYYGPGETS